MLHDLWDEGEGRQTFCSAGPHGDDARAMLEPGARLVSSVEAASHFEAMTLYYEHMGWGPYITSYDKLPYDDPSRFGHDG